MTTWLRSILCSLLAELGCPRLTCCEEVGAGKRVPPFHGPVNKPIVFPKDLP